ncbi:MAG: hypothetical protein WA274_03445 [Candidatus Acidiferrales bacterium]
MSELSKDALRKEALQIHKDVETKEHLRVEQKAAAKKERADAKARAAKQISDYPAKPTLKECDGDADVYRNEVELWQVGLDERAAQKILDSPKSSLPYRDNANRTLRKCAQRRHELYPELFAADGARLTPWKDAPTNSANAGGNAIADARSYAEREPFQGYEKRHPKSLEFGAEYQSWQNLCKFMDSLAADCTLQRENPAEYARQQQAIREADEKQRRANLVSIDHCGRVIENGAAKPYLPTNPDGSYIRSPLQKKVWGEQSREFARLRGEIVDPPVALEVETPDRSTAYRLTLDGFMFWGDNTPCESPLPAGTKVINAPTPPHYHQNENQIPAGMKFDPIAFLWMQVQ